MKTITSRDNAQYKELLKLAGSSQARRKSGRTLLDGVHLCQSYLQLRGMPEQCIVSESALQNPEVADIVGQLESQRAHVLGLPDALYNAVSQVEHGVGVMFLIETPERAVTQPLSVSAVLLDNLQDPGNVGSILRSAAAAGITQVYCSAGTAFCWSPKVLRAPAPAEGEAAAVMAPVKESDPFRKALIISLMNPKAILFFISFFIQFVDPAFSKPVLSFIGLGLICQVISFTYLTAIIFVGARLAETFRRRRRLSAGMGGGVGAMFIGFGAKLATATL